MKEACVNCKHWDAPMRSSGGTLWAYVMKSAQERFQGGGEYPAKHECTHGHCRINPPRPDRDGSPGGGNWQHPFPVMPADGLCGKFQQEEKSDHE